MHLIWFQGIQKWSFVAGERKVADYGKPFILYGGVWILSFQRGRGRVKLLTIFIVFLFQKEHSGETCEG